MIPFDVVSVATASCTRNARKEVSFGSWQVLTVTVLGIVLLLLLLLMIIVGGAFVQYYIFVVFVFAH